MFEALAAVSGVTCGEQNFSSFHLWAPAVQTCAEVSQTQSLNALGTGVESSESLLWHLVDVAEMDGFHENATLEQLKLFVIFLALWCLVFPPPAKGSI